MTYNKPTIELLGEAIRVIQGPKVPPSIEAPGDSTDPSNPPAYDLDE